MKRIAIPLLVLLLLGIAAALAYRQYLPRHVQLTIAPERGTSTTPFETAASRVGVAIKAPLARLQNEINNRLPTSFQKAGNGEDVCKKVFGKKICIGTKYDVTVARGTITVAALGHTTVRVGIPLSATGNGGFRGDGADLLGLDKKNFSANASLAADLSLTLDDAGCPRAAASLSLQSAPKVEVEIVGGVWIDLAAVLTGAIADLAEELEKAVGVAVPCDVVRAQLAQIYTTYAFPLRLPGVPPVFINFRPSGLEFSGLQFDATDLSVAAAVSGPLEIASDPIGHARVPLPTIVAINTDAPLTQLAVPIRVRYADLDQAAAVALVGIPFSFHTPGGPVQVTVRAVEFFPSNTRIVARVEFVADLPGKFLDVHGQVHLLGVPQVADGVRVSIGDLAFTRVLDNALWTTLTTAFETTLREKLSEVARFDLQQAIAETKKSVNVALTEKPPVPGVSIVVEGLELAVGRVSVAADALSVEGLVKGRVLLSAATTNNP